MKNISSLDMDKENDSLLSNENEKRFLPTLNSDKVKRR